MTETPERAEVLPCPFCGGDAILMGRGGSAPEQWVKCRLCAASSDTCSGDERAITAWNTRTQSGHRIIAEADLAAVVDALRDMKTDADWADFGKIADDKTVAVPATKLRAARAALARIEAVS